MRTLSEEWLATRPAQFRADVDEIASAMQISPKLAGRVYLAISRARRHVLWVELALRDACIEEFKRRAANNETP